MNCLHCKIELKERNINCPNCGYPNFGSKEDKVKYVEKEIMNRIAFKDTIKANKECRNILIFIGIISIILPPLLYFIDSLRFTIYNLLGAEIVGIIFIGLWLFSKTRTYLTTSIGLTILTLDFISSLLIVY